MDIHAPDVDLVKPSLGVLFDVDIDREMCIDIAHLVLETLGHADDEVVDESLDGPERSDILAGTVVEFNVDGVGIRSGEADGEMGKIFL